MERTCNYLKTVFRALRQENKYSALIVIALLCIPMDHAFGSISAGVFVGVTLITFKRKNFHLEYALLRPVVLFVLMGLSLFWSHDVALSVKALQKGLPLLLVPVCFMLFPKLTIAQKHQILKYYSFGMVFFTVFWLAKAAVRFAISNDPNVFFYHELVTEDVNAIHVSVYIAMSCFYFLTKPAKTVSDKLAIILLSVFLMLLSSKNIIVIFILIAMAYYFSNAKSRNKPSYGKWLLLFGLIVGIAFFGKIKDRFMVEYQSITTARTLNYEIGTETSKVYNISLKEAWTNAVFQQNDYFPGTAFRVYQIRIFKEMLHEDPIFFTGYGLNASDFKIKEKAVQYHLYKGYDEKNFHNEYIQIFAELGIFGLLVLAAILYINIKNAVQNKDFIHISFAILMISLFLTESFLSRQRGIMFFTIMYCLFNAATGVMPLTKKNEI